MKTSLSFIGKDLAVPIIWCLVTACLVPIFLATVNLKPKVDENFFFSSDDPELQADKRISKMFPQPPQIILSAKGDIASDDYQKRMAKLTEELLALPEVVEVQSLARGPNNLAHALSSPLWKRALISTDQRASFVSVLIKDVSIEEVISKIEKIRVRLSSPRNFKIEISGAPYIVEIIRRNLQRDLKVFSLVAFLIFAVTVFVLFRSVAILVGTILACLNVSMLTLMISSMLHIEIGPLTSNLSVIVFVLALSHIIFITFNWKNLSEAAGSVDSASEAVKITRHPSFWSMVTQLLGFASLFFVKAAPLRQLGIAGIVGTLVAFAGAYLIYPTFLRYEALRVFGRRQISATSSKRNLFFERAHQKIALSLLAISAIVGIGIFGLNTDPSMLSYFKKGGELRNGLEYIDHNGGSTPLKVVVADNAGSRLDSNDAYMKLRNLHTALEQNSSVGNVLSLPIILAEAKQNPIASILPNNWLLNLLDSPPFGEVAKYFVTKDRKNTLFLLRMREGDRHLPRLEIIKQIEEIVTKSGFSPVLTGGVYLLQAKLSELVVSSILVGLFLLVGIFTLIGGFLARSLRAAWAILVSLCMIPLCAIGIIGYFRIPFDIISSPGTNIAIGIGVDSIINMLFFAKRHSKKGRIVPGIWTQACSRLWRPVVYSTVITCMGFGIFILSTFPPTQRFGLSVILGTLMTPLAALFVFPWIMSRGKESN